MPHGESVTYRDVSPAGWRQGVVHGGGRKPSRRDPEFKPVPAELAAWTAANQRAISANRFRESREKFLDSLYIYNERAR